MVMRMIVMKLPSRKITTLLEAFESMDTNQDGQVTLLEFKRGLAQFPELCEGLDAPIEDVFLAIDNNSSGKVSLHEFLAATLDALGVVSDDVIINAFRSLDINGDGKLSKDELAIAAREIDGHMGSTHVTNLVHKLEQELGSGSLDLRDFFSLIREEGQQEPRKQAVAEKAVRERWAWCPAPLTCSRSDRGVLSHKDAQIAPSVSPSPAPRVQPKAFNPDKNTGIGLLESASRKGLMREEPSCEDRPDGFQVATTSARPPSPRCRLSPRRGRRCSKLPAQCDNTDAPLKGHRSSSPAPSDCSTECPSTPPRCA